MKTLLSIRSKISCIIVLLFVLSSCEKNDDTHYLKDQIIGTWESTNSFFKSYTFNDNNTFIDTTFTLKSDNFSEREVSEIITGDYLISDGQLTFSNIRLKYVKGQESEYFAGYSTTYDAVYKVSFENDILILNQTDVFELVSLSHSGIIGKWNHNKLIAVYDSRIDNKFTGGSIYGIYDFKSDLNVDWQYKTNYDNTINTGGYSTSYNLAEKRLTINDWGVYDMNITFSKNRMMWIYNDRTFERKH